MEFLKAIVLGLIEGVTEFLPISSTGHLILANQWIAFSPDFTKTFDIAIQSGAILAVVVVYWKNIWPFVGGTVDRAVLKTWGKILVAVVPALVLGALFGSAVKDALFSPMIVALALIVGGIALMFVEWRRHSEHIKTIERMTYTTAFLVGLVQCLALIPGTSRSAATIIGALLLGVARPAAAEFSFLLAIPTLGAATVFALMHDGVAFDQSQSSLLVLGAVAAFLSAYLVIRRFVQFIQKHDFLPFAYYRVAIGLLMLVILVAR
jgi:undecaprenyl-diphosphatase